ncbi:MAG: tetratricopeptide repeat protein [Bryobacteraceae bacterium]
MNVRKTLTQFALAAVCAAVSYGQAMTAITGVIKGADGKPIQGAEVKITRTDIKANYSIKTNKDGKFNYATLPLGTYDIVITANGATVLDTKGARTDYAKPMELNIDLSKPQPAQTAAVAAPGGAPAPPAGPAEPTEAEKKAMAEAQAKFEKDMKEYQEAQAKNEGLQTAFSAGMEAAKAKNWNAAIEGFTKASELGPTQHAVFGQLADVYQKRAESVKGAERLADYKKSVEVYQKAIAIMPTDATYRYNASVVLARSNQMDEAQAQLTEAVKLDPTGASKGYRNLGAVYFDTNRSEAAEAAYRKAIELEPNEPGAHFQLGVTLIGRATEKDGKLVAPAGTAEEFQKYLELAPTGANSEDAKGMLQALGATISNSINRGPAPKDNGKAKGKGK